MLDLVHARMYLLRQCYVHHLLDVAEIQEQHTQVMTSSRLITALCVMALLALPSFALAARTTSVPACSKANLKALQTVLESNKNCRTDSGTVWPAPAAITPIVIGDGRAVVTGYDSPAPDTVRITGTGLNSLMRMALTDGQSANLWMSKPGSADEWFLTYQPVGYTISWTDTLIVVSNPVSGLWTPNMGVLDSTTIRTDFQLNGFTSVLSNEYENMFRDGVENQWYFGMAPRFTVTTNLD